MNIDKQFGRLDYFKILAALLVIAIHPSPLSSFSGNADFVFTRIVAVPFFLMTTGFFFLPQYPFNKTKNIQLLHSFLKKPLAVVLYLPVNFYARHLIGMGFFSICILLFDGTIYHLWYLPASMLDVLLIFLTNRKLSFKVVMGIAIILYGFGLLGDTGLLIYGGFLKGIYNTMIGLFPYTRNGIFHAPIFLVLGAGTKQIPQCTNKKATIAGLVLSSVLMIIAGLTLHRLNIQRHDSMYITLLPCMLFLFILVQSIVLRPAESLRTISTRIYIIHLLSVILICRRAKLTHLKSVFVENSLVHYISVCAVSCTFAVILEKLSAKKHEKPFCSGRAWIELDIDNLRHNIRTLCGLLPQASQLMPVIKADAYGHGAVLLSKELNKFGISAFCVATVLEGVELRRNGVKGEILILGYTHPKQFSLLRKYRLTQTVIDYSYAKRLNAYGKKIKVHIKIDTGMHRLGERFERIDEICNIFCCKNLMITGTYTHLCCAETTSIKNAQFTKEQGAAFYGVVSDLEKRGYSCRKLHLLGSYGLINYPELAGDYVRIGTALYGVLSNRTDLDNCPIDLRPVLSVKARVALTKDLYAGEYAGYGLQYVAAQDKKIAVLTIGYADGIPRALSCGHGKVLINQNEAPIVGLICMDQMLVDITDIPNVKSGDIAVIIGTSGEREITVYDLAEEAGTITNELLSRLGNRLDRVLI